MGAILYTIDNTAKTPGNFHRDVEQTAVSPGSGSLASKTAQIHFSNPAYSSIKTHSTIELA